MGHSLLFLVLNHLFNKEIGLISKVTSYYYMPKFYTVNTANRIDGAKKWENKL